jgi:hypothetical protein
MALPLPFFVDAFFAAVPPPPLPVVPEREAGELAADLFVAPRAGVDAAARAFAGAFFGIAIPPKYCFSWGCVQKYLWFRLPFTAHRKTPR